MSAKKTQPRRFIIRLHRDSTVDLHTLKMSDERARRMAEGFAEREGIKVDLLVMRTHEAVASFGQAA